MKDALRDFNHILQVMKGVYDSTNMRGAMFMAISSWNNNLQAYGI